MRFATCHPLGLWECCLFRDGTYFSIIIKRKSKWNQAFCRFQDKHLLSEIYFSVFLAVFLCGDLMEWRVYTVAFGLAPAAILTIATIHLGTHSQLRVD
jgi:hypothetical protein